MSGPVRDKSRPRVDSNPARPRQIGFGARLSIAWRQNLPIVRFVGLFLGLLGVFHLVYFEFVTPSAAFAWYLNLSSRVAAAMLALVGEQVTVSGDVMRSSFSMSVKQGCDGLQAMAILAIGVLAFPVAIAKKIPGVAFGVGLLLGLNLVRIASLFWAGLHAQKQFQTLHVHVWPAILIFSAWIFWVLWAMWATRPRNAE